MAKAVAALLMVLVLTACGDSPTAPSRISNHVEPPGIVPATGSADQNRNGVQNHVEPPGIVP